MADTCNVTIRFHPRHKEKIEEAFSAANLDDRVGTPEFADDDSLEFAEVPWAGHDAWPELGERLPGIPFIVDHGSSYGWGFGFYVWDGDILGWGPSTFDCVPCIMLTSRGEQGRAEA